MTCYLVGTTGDPGLTRVEIRSRRERKERTGEERREEWCIHWLQQWPLHLTPHLQACGGQWCESLICASEEELQPSALSPFPPSHTRALAPFQVLMMHLATGYAPGSSFSLIHILHEGSLRTAETELDSSRDEGGVGTRT